MAEQAGDKSFEATPHRRQQAREKGQIAYSQDLGSAVLLLIGVLLLVLFGGAVMETAAEFMRYQLGEVGELAISQETILRQGQALALSLAAVVLPVMGLLMLGGLATSIFQVGFLWVPERVVPDLSKLSPIKGLKRIFSITGFARLGFGLFKVLVISTVASVVLWVRREEILRASWLDIPQLSHFLTDIVLSTLLWTGLALLVLAILDYAVQRLKHEKDLRMTHQEIRDEMKNYQGDPQIAARRRAIQRQLVLNRMSSAVPKADVIVTNPTELAVAIQYDPLEMAAPIVVAKGSGTVAQRIRKIGLEHNIPIVERKPLAQQLFKEVEVGHPIPTGAYAAVAEVLAFVYQLKGKKLPTPRVA